MTSMSNTAMQQIASLEDQLKMHVAGSSNANNGNKNKNNNNNNNIKNKYICTILTN